MVRQNLIDATGRSSNGSPCACSTLRHGKSPARRASRKSPSGSSRDTVQPDVARDPRQPWPRRTGRSGSSTTRVVVGVARSVHLRQAPASEFDLLSVCSESRARPRLPLVRSRATPAHARVAPRRASRVALTTLVSSSLCPPPRDHMREAFSISAGITSRHGGSRVPP